MPVDLGAEYLSGMRTAASIANERTRLSQERAHAEMEAQSHAAVENRLALENQARLQTVKAYHDAELGIRQQRLEQAAAINQQKVREEALKMADQHGFANDLASGMPIEQALFRHPRLSSPSAALAAHRQSLDRTADRIDIAKRNLDLRGRELGDREAHEVREREKGSGIVGLDTTGGLTLRNVESMSGPGQALIHEKGTNLPPEVRASLLRPGTPPLATPNPSGKTVRVKHPDGKSGFIPVSNLPAALKQGYTEIKDDGQ